MATSIDWKLRIRQQLQHRNHKQCHPFTSLIQTNNRLQEISSKLQSKNVQLQVEVERLREHGHTISDGSLSSNHANTHALEQKLFRLQEELTEMHKRKGENSQQIIDLTAVVQEKEKEMQQKDNMISDLVNSNVALKHANRNLETSLTEMEATNQMLNDEHQALQMAFAALQEKYQKCQDDLNDLVQRWMEVKAKDAEKMNAENQDFIKDRQRKLTEELARAAEEPVAVDPSKSPFDTLTPVVCVAASVPSRSRHVFDGHDGEVYSVQWNTSGRLFATGGADRKIKLWDYHNSSSCDLKGTLGGSNAGIMSLDFSPDEAYIIGASNDFASRIWSIQDQRLRHTLTGHSGKVLTAKFLSENRVVSGSHDRTLKVWDLHSKSCMKTIFAGSSCNDLVTLHGNTVISGHFDRRVRFWDSRTSSDSSTTEILLSGRLTSLDLARDKTQLLCCTRDDCLKIIDLRMNTVMHTLVADGFKVHCDWSRAVLSPDLSYAAAGSGDGNLYVWNIAKAKVEKVLKDHSHAVLACSWNPVGNSIVSCEKGKKIVVWADY